MKHRPDLLYRETEQARSAVANGVFDNVRCRSSDRRCDIYILTKHQIQQSGIADICASHQRDMQPIALMCAIHLTVVTVVDMKYFFLIVSKL